jgi:hypothetical protein
MKRLAVLAVVAVLVTATLQGCAFVKALDWDDDPKSAFDFRFGWDHGVVQSKAKEGEVDKDGVYQPEGGASTSILAFPGVSTGLVEEIKPKARMTPVVALEAFRFKTPVPYFRWWVVQVGGGAQLAEVYLGKLLVPVVDITLGGWYGWDFDRRRGAYGIGGTIFKF